MCGRGVKSFGGQRSVDFCQCRVYSASVGFLRKEVMPMVQLLRAVLVNTVGRLLADLVRRLFD